MRLTFDLTRLTGTFSQHEIDKIGKMCQIVDKYFSENLKVNSF